MNKIVKPFQFATMKTVSDFETAMRRAGLEFPVSENLEALTKPVAVGRGTSPNAMVIHPLEGYDGTPDGKPSDLIFRRYRRYAQGGAGLIWYEATAVSADGRCNPYQMMITDDTVGEIARLVKQTNAHAVSAFGRKPYNVLQLTHSGRSSTDDHWNPIPLAAADNPLLDRFYPGRVVASDERIEQLADDVVHGAVLAVQAGFDSVDVKICHNYIMRELLSAFTRPGKYGGSFENRTRFLFGVLDRIEREVGDALDICVRINAYDCIPYPYGWGMAQEEGALREDLTEPIRLIRMLVDRGVRLVNVSTMMPRYQPVDTGYLDSYEGRAVLNPYQSTAHLLAATRTIKQSVPEAVVVATGLSWLEQFCANVGAGGIEHGWFDMAGFGRQAFAYPDFAKDVLEKGRLERGKCCITCDKCYELIRMHEFSGCVIRDQEAYLDRYRRAVARERAGKEA